MDCGKIPRNILNTQGKGCKRQHSEDKDDLEYEPSTAGKSKRIKTSKKPTEILKQDLDYDPYWEYSEVLSQQMHIPQRTCQMVINLLDQDNTIPFIARYRKEVTGNMDANKLRELNESYSELKEVRAKVDTAIKTLSKKEQLNPNILKSFQTVTHMEDFEHLYQPFKTTKSTLAGRARSLGLELAAQDILQKPNKVFSNDIRKFVNTSIKGLDTVTAVEEGVQHIIADIIAKDSEILKFVQEKFVPEKLKLESKASRNLTKKKDDQPESSRDSSAHKYENYYNFRKTVSEVESHQVLAINRGESLKILSVKIDIPDYLLTEYSKFAYSHVCKGQFISNNFADKMLKESITESFTRFIQSLVTRRMRSNLTKKAEKSAVSVFAKNLKNLLLTPPVRGKIVMGIDPGFTKGCKIAVVSPIGDVLHTSTLLLHVWSNSYKEQEKLAAIVNEFRCEIIGIGNGTACRETEEVVSRMIKERKVDSTRVVFCIVNESGISIYSVSDDAILELPHLDPNLRSAVSLARRVVDPLLEYVKVEPKHLGVGMYQHDVSETALKRTLDSIVEECVSDVGIDLNTCTSTAILSKVAGLSKVKASNILKWKQTNGSFTNREQLKLITGIGLKTYEQCAGFLRIEPSNSPNSTKCSETKNRTQSKVTKSKAKIMKVDVKNNHLDRTIIHPESYSVVYKLLNLLGLKCSDIGSAAFIKAIKTSLDPEKIQDLVLKLDVGSLTLNLIADGLQKCLDYDIRFENKGPLFKNSIRDVASLYPGLNLTGKVMNVTDFGAFVDVGVGINGLIHRSQMKIGYKTRVLLVGDVVNVRVLDVDTRKQRIGLCLVSVVV